MVLIVDWCMKILIITAVASPIFHIIILFLFSLSSDFFSVKMKWIHRANKIMLSLKSHKFPIVRSARLSICDTFLNFIFLPSVGKWMYLCVAACNMNGERDNQKYRYRWSVVLGTIVYAVKYLLKVNVSRVYEYFIHFGKRELNLSTSTILICPERNLLSIDEIAHTRFVQVPISIF